MDRHHRISMRSLKVAASLLGVSLAVAAGVIFVSFCRVFPGEFTPPSLLTDLATIPILLSVPAALVIAWGLHYWRKSHPVDLILLGDKDDRLTPVKKR